MRKHLLILLGSCVLVAGARIVFKEAYARQAHRVQEKAFKDRAREVEQFWQKMRYTQATETNLSVAAAAKIDWGSLALTETQKLKLRTRFDQTISYLTAPNFEEYYRLKTHDLHYQFIPDPSLSNYFANVSEISENQLYSTLSNFWVSYHSTNKIPALTAICLESVAAEVTRTNSSEALLKGKVAKYFILIHAAVEPGFRYSSTQPTNFAKESFGPEAPVCFNSSFYIQAKPNGASGPIFLSLVWSPIDSNWALCRLESDEWLGFRALF